jgi:hypothetical protein
MLEKIAHRDALYLFACHLEWDTRHNLAAYEELLAALDDRESAFAGLQNRFYTETHQGQSELGPS